MAKLTEEEKAQRALNRRRKAALETERDENRREERQREWVANGMYPTRAEINAGAGCRGCGLPVADRLGSWPPLLKLDAEQREQYDLAEADFKRRHPDCRSHRWTLQGSRAQHCGYCCPPPPLSEEQVAAIREIFSSSKPDPSELDTWLLTLTCDHVVEAIQHRSNTSWYRSVTHCPACQQVRGIISSVELPPDGARLVAEKRNLQESLTRARVEEERLRKRAGKARQRVNLLEEQLADLDTSGGRPARQGVSTE